MTTHLPIPRRAASSDFQRRSRRDTSSEETRASGTVRRCSVFVLPGVMDAAPRRCIGTDLSAMTA
ncbi:hypothetical protein LRX75_17800 [Rhizobium sp. DKSPLA3]|uniref:Uncharacterized protein n=2 Tax=Rhizobium quercicola TaxID=2901226 RepID=A0A9X1T2F6_9HYPH|nr:hypothetical protein [Rhizobium quercicola]